MQQLRNANLKCPDMTAQKLKNFKSNINKPFVNNESHLSQYVS